MISFISRPLSIVMRPLSFVPLFLISCLTTQISFAQNTTYSSDEKKKEPIKTEIKDNRKVLVIPFEPKLYMSEIDQHVNKETKMNFNEIRQAFRSGLDYTVVAEFKKKYSVISIMNDTLKSVKDQRYIYESIGYKYEIVPPVDGTTAKASAVNESKIQNGQLTVASNDQKKYMNAKIINPNLLSTLSKRYGADIFIFVNQLDIKNDVDNSGKSATSYFRVASVHYSIYDINGKLLNSGLATKNFSGTINNPNKIVNGCFSEIAKAIYGNYVFATTPKVDEDKGVLQWQAPK